MQFDASVYIATNWRMLSAGNGMQFNGTSECQHPKNLPSGKPDHFVQGPAVDRIITRFLNAVSSRSSSACAIHDHV